MSFECKEQDERILMKVRGELTIYETPDIRKALVEAFENAAGVDLDLEEIDTCDAAGLQLLCAARITAEEENKHLRITQASSHLLMGLERAGMVVSDVLGPEWQGGTAPPE